MNGMEDKTMLYGNSSEGYSYSPDRRNDYVDRFNPSTRANYTTSYNPYGYGVYTPKYDTKKSSGWYDGRGQYHAN